MKNLEYLLATREIPNYTQAEVLSILTKECELNGKSHQITVCMEEFAELIEVICENIIKGRVDIIHLKEELVDCAIALEYLKIIFNIGDINVEDNLYDKDNCLNNCILNLSSCITKLSKCIREKVNAHTKIVSVYTTILETIDNIQKFYNISEEDSDIVKISNLKIERCLKRNTAKIEYRDGIVIKQPILSEIIDTEESEN